jgi:alcohol dehydrogenase
MLAMVVAGTLDPSILVTREVGLIEGATALKEMGNSTQVLGGITIINPNISAL